MKLQFVISPELGVNFIRFTGRIRFKDLLEGQHLVLQHPDYRPSYHSFTDLRQARLELSSQEVQRFRECLQHNKDTSGALGRMAMVVDREVDYGLCRMWCFLADQLYAGQDVFRDSTLALDWLDLSPDFDLNSLFETQRLNPTADSDK
jgi:hypothetical protein